MRVLSIERAANGFVIEACVPLKKDKGKSEFCCSSEYSSIVVKDEKELIATVGELIPKLNTEYKDRDEFEDAFKEATK